MQGSIIVDNYATHKHGKVRAWLAKGHASSVHYTPTYSSWFNQVERWFGLITQQAIRRASFRSVRELIRRIEDFVQHYNRHSRPFGWTATADSIFQKLTRLVHEYQGHHTSVILAWQRPQRTGDHMRFDVRRA